jgi:hypothetical protein
VTRPVSATGCLICQLPQPQAALTTRATEASARRRAVDRVSTAAQASSADTPHTRNETPYTAVIEATWANGRSACWL